MSEAARGVVRLVDPLGLHARAGAAVVRVLGGLPGATVRFGGRSAPAGSVLALMGLGARVGDVLELVVAPEATEQLRAGLGQLGRSSRSLSHLASEREFSAARCVAVAGRCVPRFGLRPAHVNAL